MSSTVE